MPYFDLCVFLMGCLESKGKDLFSTCLAVMNAFCQEGLIMFSGLNMHLVSYTRFLFSDFLPVMIHTTSSHLLDLHL